MSSKLAKMLGFKGYLPLTPTPTARSKRELGQPLLSRERAKLRGRGRTENWDSPLVFTHIIIMRQLYDPHVHTCISVFEIICLTINTLKFKIFRFFL